MKASPTSYCLASLTGRPPATSCWLPVLALLLATLFPLSRPVAAEAPSAEVAMTSSAYVVGVENIDYYPHYAFTFRSSYTEALFELFTSTQGVSFEYSALPVQRLFDGLLESHTIDFKFPDSPDWAPERKQGHTVYYSDPISEFVEGIYVLPERRGQGIDKIKRLGIVQGFTPNALSDALANQQVELVREGDLGKLLLMCLRGEVDGVYANLDLSHHWVTQSSKPPHGLMFDPDLPFVRGQFHLSTTRHPQLIKQLNEFMHREQPQLQALRELYGLQQTQTVEAL